MDLEKIKQQLLEKKAQIIESLENNSKESQNEKSGVEDTADEVTAELSRETLYKLSQTEREKLFLIEIALKKIENGTYGICEECGAPIGEKRLEALPWVRLCIECSEKDEAMRLSTGYEDINYYNILPDTSTFIEEEDNRNIAE
ncbi:TraR/DksA family transcriptional regulator [Hydrogenivirga sp. 128-5-R1-1]|uniref:TraR/DksA family transcriptional regulator n=1 Tax=Hydrogenivirga sp. 128-5-R1-1 TaxID=392423 RepID=UPI00015F0162|nr:TraR/DksA family transcriptional regulator [Hydrogenivirga sp. 128-5-R1-1]EDP73971.1 dnaK suppressor protein [Hydrogenivirga sp. 128-5-R1-1]